MNMRKLKVYEISLGRVRVGICTDTKKRAVELLKVKANQLDKYGSVRDEAIESDRALLDSQHTPMERPTNQPKPIWYPVGTCRKYATYERACNESGSKAASLSEWFAQQSTTHAAI